MGLLQAKKQHDAAVIAARCDARIETPFAHRAREQWITGLRDGSRIRVMDSSDGSRIRVMDHGFVCGIRAD
jgi:hypothetical protein